jgi:hypothetical protein
LIAPDDQQFSTRHGIPRAEMNLFPPKRTSRSAKDGHDHVIVRISSSIIAIHPEPLGVIMRSFIQIGVVIAACGSAIFWFTSAMCRLPSIKPGTDELDTVTELSKALQRMNRWNFWAAGLMGVTALLSALARFLG